MNRKSLGLFGVMFFVKSAQKKEREREGCYFVEGWVKRGPQLFKMESKGVSAEPVPPARKTKKQRHPGAQKVIGMFNFALVM